MSRSALLAIVLFAFVGALQESAKASDWNGHQQIDFNVGGRGALLVAPKNLAPGKYWTWRAEFFGIDPQADITTSRTPRRL